MQTELGKLENRTDMYLSTLREYVEAWERRSSCGQTSPMGPSISTSALPKYSPSFIAREREAIVTMVATDPECGDLMQGTGGVRKVRVGRGGREKSGGGRVVYIHHDAGHPIFLLAAFAKNEKANLTKAERVALTMFVKTLFKPGREDV